MDQEKKSRIEISDPAIVSLVEEAANSVQGVFGLHREFLTTLSGLFGRRRGTSGVEITSEDDRISLDVHITIEAAAFFPAVVSELKDKIRKNLEGTTPLKIRAIDIFIDDLHVSK